MVFIRQSLVMKVLCLLQLLAVQVRSKLQRQMNQRSLLVGMPMFMLKALVALPSEAVVPVPIMAEAQQLVLAIRQKSMP
jgi:hypothetical protein